MSTVDLTEVAGARATHKFARMSASKARAVLALIRDEDVNDAQDILRFSERGAADVVGKVLASAIANATNNEGLDADELYVAECFANEGPTLKRWRPRARGRATRINKRTCHITVVVAQMDDDELELRQAAQEAAGSTGGNRADRRARVAASRAADDVPEDTTDEVVTDEAAADDEGPVTDEAAVEEWNAEDADTDGEANATDETPYGDGSMAPPADGSIPEGYPVKGNADSMKYHEPDGRWYDATVAEVYFVDAATAEAAGFIKAGTKAASDDADDENEEA